MRKYSLKNIILHPFLLGLYPAIALLGHNISETRISDAVRAVLLIFIAVTIIVLVLRLILRSWQRAALGTTFFIVVFFSYSYIYDFFQQASLDSPIGRHRFLIPIYLLIIGIGLWWIKKVRDLDTATQTLNLIGLVAVIFPLYQIISHRVITTLEVAAKRAGATTGSEIVTSDNLVYPDVYYIILDAYPRDDILQGVFDYDNSEFLNQLREMGFYIAECSQSNYSKTSHSLTSSLNLNYIDVLEGGDIRDFKSPATWIRFNEVKKNLDALGYTTVAFSTGFPDTELTDVDIYLQADTVSMDVFGPADVINNFEALLIDIWGLPLIDALSLFDIDILSMPGNANVRSLVDLSPLKQRYGQVVHAFNELDNISSIPGPKFVFAHIIAPHDPYIFASDGTFTPLQEQGRDAYIHQLTYVNQRIIPAITEIIEASDTPPIIIIQGDHGATEVEFTPLRVMILNAYYLPNGGDQMLYSTITPVNTFRLIFDYYFSGEYSLIEDISYNSKSKEDTLDYEIVPNLCDR